MTSEPSGMTLPSVIRAFAPIRQFFPITARPRTTAPMPIRVLSPIVQLWSMAMCPTVTLSPIVSGSPGSECRTLPSWMLVFAPMTIGSLSPRTVTPNQTLAPDFNVTSPTTTALSAIQYSPSGGNRGFLSASE
jgi:hypothetical protein